MNSYDDYWTRLSLQINGIISIVIRAGTKELSCPFFPNVVLHESPFRCKGLLHVFADLNKIECLTLFCDRLLIESRCSLLR